MIDLIEDDFVACADSDIGREGDRGCHHYLVIIF
jgi:hypothetical protein